MLQVCALREDVVRASLWVSLMSSGAGLAVVSLGFHD